MHASISARLAPVLEIVDDEPLRGEQSLELHVRQCTCIYMYMQTICTTHMVAFALRSTGRWFEHVAVVRTRGGSSHT